MKKLKILLTGLIVLVTLMMFSNTIYATNTMDLNITNLRPYTSKEYTVTTPNGNVHTIFKIQKRVGEEYSIEDAIYCLRSGLGFGNTELPDVSLELLEDVTYTETYNLKTQATAVINYYRNTIGYENISNIEYNSILWLIDNMYLPEHKDSSEMKQGLLDNAGIVNSELTDDDIEFVQQMALWYFSNYDENAKGNSLSLASTYVLSNTAEINGEALSENKARQVDILLRYLVNTAIENVETYGTGDLREIAYVKPEFNLNSNEKTLTIESEFIKVGPFNISQKQGNVDYILDILVKDNEGTVIPEKIDDISIIYVVDNEGNSIPSIMDAVGTGDFYLKIPKAWTTEYNLEDVNIEIVCECDKVYKTTATLWLASNEEQPVLKVEKEEILEGEFNVVIEKVDENGNLLFGAEFTMLDENGQRITITNNGDGTFNSPTFKISEPKQEFIYEIEEILSPSGYVGINGAIKIKITTKANDEETAYMIDKAEFINTAGEEITIEGMSLDIVNNRLTIKVINEKIKEIDLSLRKYITKVNGVEVNTRVPEINTSMLDTIDQKTGKKITTATYTHSKQPVIVKQGDIVTYTIRIYNEGQLDGYVLKVADYIPEGLGYLMDYKANTDNFWVPVSDETIKTIDLIGEDGLYDSVNAISNLTIEDFYAKDSLEDVKVLSGNAKIYTTALEDEVIKAYNSEITAAEIEKGENWQQSTEGENGLYYKDVEVTCIVLAENSFKGTLRNIAEIKEYTGIDKSGEKVNTSDRDSMPENVDINNYNPPIDNSTYQQDDDDYELLELKYFDLALRKFITAVNEEEIKTRIPEATINSNGELEYIHDKTPVYVANSDLITYTIRAYNEGTVNGYSLEISDDIPDGVVFLPEHDLNKEYNWKMYDINGEETDEYTKAVEIRTTYLEDTILKAFDATKEISNTEQLNPYFADVKVVFQVIEEEITQEDRIIINKAQITQDKAVDNEGNELQLNDEDSIPNKWNEDEDDQDIEKIYVQIFDLALLKWVAQTIVTVDGTTITTDTGFTPYDNPEPIAKVVIDKNKINKTTVKFVYNIVIINQGQIEGYATEITDYIPEGLEFVAEDNPLWKKEGDSKITTRALEEKLLKPGESAIVSVIFRWKNDAENFGLKTNIAEISEDYNEKGSKDIDSIPDNVEVEEYDKQQEDDDDKALVILETKTGGEISYIWLGLIVLLIIASGIALIQKYIM